MGKLFPTMPCHSLLNLVSRACGDFRSPIAGLAKSVSNAFRLQPCRLGELMTSRMIVFLKWFFPMKSGNCSAEITTLEKKVKAVTLVML